MAKISKKRFLELAEQFNVKIDVSDSKVNLFDFVNAVFIELNKSKNKWIPWSGGDCPVDPKTILNVKFRDGEIGKNEMADMCGWEHHSEVYDIIAYKIVKD